MKQHHGKTDKRKSIKQHLVIFLLSSILSVSFLIPKTHAQMMGNYPTTSPTITLSPQDKQEISEGGKLYQQLQSKQITCGNLKDNDFDKIGEYVMEQQVGNSEKHAQLNQMMSNMMGEQRETNMHVLLGRRATNCYAANTTGGGVSTMMGWNYTSMMNNGFWFFGSIIWIIASIDLVLLGFLLWKQLRKR